MLDVDGLTYNVIDRGSQMPRSGGARLDLPSTALRLCHSAQRGLFAATRATRNCPVPVPAPLVLRNLSWVINQPNSHTLPFRHTASISLALQSYNTSLFCPTTIFIPVITRHTNSTFLVIPARQ